MRHVRWENKRIARRRHFHVVDVAKHATCTAAKQQVWVVQAEHPRVVALGGVRLGREIEPEHTGDIGMWLGVKRQVLAVAEDGFASDHAADVALELVLDVPSQTTEDRFEVLRIHEVQAVAVGARIWNLVVVQAFIGFEGQF